MSLVYDLHPPVSCIPQILAVKDRIYSYRASYLRFNGQLLNSKF
jgi:hypothetical protein